METVVFKTPGMLDFKAFTHFGVNAKPNSKSPIGYFGTGLKYAIAVLIREGCKVTILRGNERWDFTTAEEAFRDKKFGFIRCYKRGIFRTETLQLPFTTDLGKDWELWQAFRELYSNTLDEGGITCISSDGYAEVPIDGYTMILVEGSAFAREYFEKDNTFHPKASRDRNDVKVEHFLEPSKHIYYRGMRVYDLEKPAKMTYNILCQIELTEDRTAKNSYEVERLIREYIVESADIPLIKAAITAPEGSYEHRFNFDSTYRAPSQTFRDTARSTRSYNSTVKSYVDTYDPPAKEPEDEPLLTQLKKVLEKDNGDWQEFVRDNLSELIAALDDADF